ncbi:MAG TPA: hypothetical protein DEQ62_05745 [Verrucomicrobiales bacterium]|nr:hypothetical protein [Verrucomicrobiales bacterium]
MAYSNAFAKPDIGISVAGEGFAGLGEGGAAAGNWLARMGDGVIAQKKPPAIGMAGGLGLVIF